jgi:hypothetical protein
MNNDYEKIPIKNDDPSRYAHLTPAQKWRQAVKLREMAWNLKSACIRQNHQNVRDTGSCFE